MSEFMHASLGDNTHQQRLPGGYREESGDGGLSDSYRILVLAPTQNDARLTVEFLTAAGLQAESCPDVKELCRQVRGGCGAILVAEEALDARFAGDLARTLSEQPSWSDIPVAMITTSSEASVERSARLAIFGPSGNVTLIERPFRPSTLVSTFEVALRARRRQYQVRRLLDERTRAEEALRDADRRKDEFLAMLAHELRNPLASLLGAAKVTRGGDGLEDRLWAIDVIERQAGLLGRLVDDLLDVSRITSGKIRLRSELIDAAVVLDRALESARPLFVERQHQLLSNFPRDSLWLHADPTRLEQIMLNLLTNAAKYTPPGGRIELTAGHEHDYVTIQVRDNGVGIPPDRLPEMFQLFAQGERSIARSEGGLGIGLTIVQKLAELHGGRVDAHSGGADKGSTFIIRLPRGSAPVSKAPPANAESDLSVEQGLRVLVVDDNVDTAEGLARLLSRAGHSVQTAHDGHSALQKAQEAPADVVLLDIGLPGMSGYDVARHLREETGCATSLIVAISGYGQDDDRRRSIAAGFDHHLVKPIDLGSLKQLLSQYARSVRPVAQESNP